MEGPPGPAQGIQMAELRSRACAAAASRALLQLPGRLFAAIAAGMRHLSAEQPDVVLGMGGMRPSRRPGGGPAPRAPVVHEQERRGRNGQSHPGSLGAPGVDRLSPDVAAARRDGGQPRAPR